MKKFNPWARHRARKFLMQALYQWDMTDHDIVEIETTFVQDNNMNRIDIDFFHEILHAIPKTISEIDALYLAECDRDIAALDPIEKAILRLATYELLARTEVPFRVVINEATELAKIFGATDGYKYINAVLDPLAQKLRADEINTSK